MLPEKRWSLYLGCIMLMIDHPQMKYTGIRLLNEFGWLDMDEVVPVKYSSDGGLLGNMSHSMNRRGLWSVYTLCH